MDILISRPWVGKTLISFLSSVEAAAFATRQGCKLSSGDFPIVCKDNDAFARLIAEYESQQMIDCVKIYARTPIHLEFSPAKGVPSLHFFYVICSKETNYQETASSIGFRD